MFVSTRARLREVLASFTGQAPSTIEFEYGTTGKPRIANGSMVRFNVSHSHSVCLIAVARGREIGVDIEYQQRPMPHINREVFSPNEAERILASSDPLTSFYDHWTLKEAALKAAGVGFSSPSAQTDLVPGMVCPFRDFAVRNLDIAIGFSAGLAIQIKSDEVLPAVIVHHTEA